MYIIACEYLCKSIGYYEGIKKKKGPVFESGIGATKRAIKYKSFSAAKREMKKLKVWPGGEKAKLFIMPEDVYKAYEERLGRRAEQLRKEAEMK